MAAVLNPVGGANMMIYGLTDEDADAEHEDDPMVDAALFSTESSALQEPQTQLPNNITIATDRIDANVDDDVRGGRVDEGEGEATGLANVLEAADEAASELNDDEEPAAISEDPSDASDEASDKASSDAGSDGVAEWEEQSDDQDEEFEAGSNKCCL